MSSHHHPQRQQQPEEPSPLKNIKFVLRIMLFASKNRISRLLELSSVCSDWRDALESNGEFVFGNYMMTSNESSSPTNQVSSPSAATSAAAGPQKLVQVIDSRPLTQPRKVILQALARLCKQSSRRLCFAWLVNSILDCDASKDLVNSEYSYFGKPILNAVSSASGTYLDLVKMLVARGGNLNTQNLCGESALFLTKDPFVFRWLLQNGADPREANTEGLKPIHKLAEENNWPCLAVLLDPNVIDQQVFEIDVNEMANQEGNRTHNERKSLYDTKKYYSFEHQETPLELACRFSCLETVQFLVNKAKAVVTKKAKENYASSSTSSNPEAKICAALLKGEKIDIGKAREKLYASVDAEFEKDRVEKNMKHSTVGEHTLFWYGTKEQDQKKLEEQQQKPAEEKKKKKSLRFAEG